jgi:uncharacterized membrane protein (DUF4010 family)
MNPTTLYLRLGLALAIGLLVGLQRESAKEKGQAGIRTFALIALSGFVIGLLAAQFDGWIIAAAVVFLSVITGITHFLSSRQPDHGAGSTTEIAALLVFGIGAYLANPESDQSLAVVVAGVAALLLHYKAPMHQFVRGLGETDLRAIMQFVLISLVILPVLPNRAFGPYAVFNPFHTWLMVVLIVGIGLAGYIAYRLVGARAGTLLSGLLGGTVSSTATTVSASRETASQPDRVMAASLIIVISTAVSIARVLIEMAVVDFGNLAAAGPPILAYLGVFIVLAFMMFRSGARDTVQLAPPQNPAELKPAILFGLLYVAVLFAVAAARQHFGYGGLYLVALASGITDLDAITLSTSALMRDGSVAVSTGWRVILVAALANLGFKAGIVAIAGGRVLFRRLAVPYAVALGAGAAIVLFWPAASAPITPPKTKSPPPSGSAPAASPQNTQPNAGTPR